MDELDESFQLLSTMSPKVHKTKKTALNRKVVTKLSLKRNIRRSSIYDNLQPTIKTCDVELSDYTSTDSSTHSLVKKAETITIDASTEDECPLPVEEGLLSKSRYNYIENWIEIGTREKSNSDDDEELCSKLNDLSSKNSGDDKTKLKTNKVVNTLNDKTTKYNENDLLSKYLGGSNSEYDSSKFQHVLSKTSADDKTNSKATKKPNNASDLLSKYLGENNSEDSSIKYKHVPSKTSGDDKTNNKVAKKSNDKGTKYNENNLLSKYLGDNISKESSSKELPAKTLGNDKTNNKVSKKSNDEITKYNENDLLSKYLGDNISKESSSNELTAKTLGNVKTNNKVSKRSNDKITRCNENDLLPNNLGKNNLEEISSKFKDLPIKSLGVERTNTKVGGKSNDKIGKFNDLLSKNDNLESLSKFKDSTSKNSFDAKTNSKVGKKSSTSDKITKSKENDLLSKYVVNLGESVIEFQDSTSKNVDESTNLDNEKNTKYHDFCEPLNKHLDHNVIFSSTVCVSNDDLVPDSSVKAIPSNQRTNSQFVRTTEADLVSKYMNRRKNSKENGDNDIKEVQINKKNVGKVTDKENKKNTINLEFNTPTKLVENELEVTSCLDELYGKGWRLNAHNVMSEKKVKPRKEESVKVAKTEVKPKKTESFDRRKQDVGKSPWLLKLKALCDTESDDEDQNGIKVKQKLQFDDCEDSESSESSDFDLKDKIKGKNDGKSDTKKSTKENKENLNKIMPPPPSKKPQNNKPIKQKLPVSKVHEISKILISDSDDDSSDDLDFESKLMDKLNVVKTIMKTNKVNPKKDKNEEEEMMGNLDKLLHRISLQAKPMTKSSTRPITFLESLSKTVPLEKCELSLRLYRKNFKTHRDELSRKLFKLYNTDIFDSCMPEDMPLEWSDKLTRTAGYCSCKKITRRTGAIERKVKIVLSSKVLDSPDRLRDTLVHELCHAATWIVDKVSNGHGAYWQAWAVKAMKVFPELPPIKRCHDYAINTKFTYRCTQCGYSFGRHSKSLDITRKCCGICRGRFEVLLNKTSKNGETKAVPVDAKKAPTGFALFVKENYGNYKSQSLKHAEVMQILGKKFSEMKVAKT